MDLNQIRSELNTIAATHPHLQRQINTDIVALLRRKAIADWKPLLEKYRVIAQESVPRLNINQIKTELTQLAIIRPDLQRQINEDMTICVRGPLLFQKKDDWRLLLEKYQLLAQESFQPVSLSQTASSTYQPISAARASTHPHEQSQGISRSGVADAIAAVECDPNQIALTSMPSKPLHWLASQPTNLPLSITQNDQKLHQDILEWIDIHCKLDQLITTRIQDEERMITDYQKVSSIIDTATILCQSEDRCTEELDQNLHQHVETILSFENSLPPLVLLPLSPSPLLQRIDQVTRILQGLYDQNILRCSQLEAMPLNAWYNELEAVLDGKSEPDIHSGFESIQRGIQKRIIQHKNDLTVLTLQLEIAPQLPHFIHTIDAAIQERLTLLHSFRAQRETQQLATIQALRSSLATVASFLIKIYRGQINFFTEECQYLTPKLKNARAVGLSDVVTNLQDQMSTIESRITSIDAKVKQIIGLQQQFGVDVPAVETCCSNDSPHHKEDELLIRVKEKEKLLMTEAIHTVEQVVEYETMVETIRRQNNDLKARLTQGQQELLEILVCPITQEVMIDPVLAADHHTYERQAIELWLRNNNRSPLTNQTLPHKNLESNWLVKNVLNKMRQLYMIREE